MVYQPVRSSFGQMPSVKSKFLVVYQSSGRLVSISISAHCQSPGACSPCLLSVGPLRISTARSPHAAHVLLCSTFVSGPTCWSSSLRTRVVVIVDRPCRSGLDPRSSPNDRSRMATSLPLYVRTGTAFGAASKHRIWPPSCDGCRRSSRRLSALNTPTVPACSDARPCLLSRRRDD
jgi:hypothetical protein